MKKTRVGRRLLMVMASLAVLAVAQPAGAGEHTLGFGVNYWKTVDDLKDSGFKVKDDGLSQIASYQYRPGGMIAFEFDLEYFDKGFGGAIKDAYSPQAYVLLGRNWYAGAGVGTTYSKDFKDEISDPFFAAKAGLRIGLLPHLDLDINANYRFDAWSELNRAGTDTVFLGAMARLTL